MWHALLRDAKLYDHLLAIDRDIAEGAHAEGCACGASLHRASYPRKPRGPPIRLPEGYGRRFSYCCARRDCRRRTTPPSVRFLGRRVYLGVVVVLVSAMTQGVTSWRAAQLTDALGVDRRTLGRWRSWWLEGFVQSPLWRAERGRLMPPVDEAGLPGALLERFVDGEPFGRVTGILEFLKPLSNSSSSSMVF